MTKLDRFVAEREDTWTALGRLLASHAGKRDRFSEAELRWLARAYRTTAADLATARRRFPGHPVVGRLDTLVRQSFTIINRDSALTDELEHADLAAWVGWRSFCSRRYWQLVASRPILLVLCTALLIAPTLMAVVWYRYDPARAAGLLPPGFAGRETPDDLGFSVGEQSAFASQIFTNNIRVSFLVFAAGITAGIGTGYVLVMNGLLLGAVIGASIEAGSGDAVFALVMPHGVLELSIIIVTAAAGLRIGWALVNPGRERRIVALVREARIAVMIVIGTIPWFVLAGLVEGFYTPAGFGVVPAAFVGIGLGAAYWILVAWRGRVSNDTQPSQPSRRLDRERRRILAPLR